MLATPSTTGLGYLVRSVSVAKWPAASAVSVMPKRAHSIDSTRVRFSTAARAAEECAIPGRPWCGERVTFTILPAFAGIIALVATAWVISQVPSTFRRITVRKPLGVMSSAGVMYWPPALFTSTSMRPWRSSTPSTNALHLVLLADVALARLAAAVLAQRDGLLQRLEAPPADHDLRPAGGELHRGGAAEARASSRYECDLAREEVRSEELGRHRGGSLPAPASSHIPARTPTTPGRRSPTPARSNPRPWPPR